MIGESGLNTLMSFQYNNRFVAGAGGRGLGKNLHGRNGEDLSLPVPLGTQVWVVNGEVREIYGEVTEEGQKLRVAKGGRGGRGNKNFASPTNRTPLLAEAGGVGEALTLGLELKLLADVGIVGLPNVGKSSLLSASSRARPKIADYIFTTVEPVLGVVESKGETFVAVDIPGLLEGAHKGVGLGHDFLRHVERTRVLIHIVDGDSADPVKDWQQINEELEQFDSQLASKPQVLAINKIDLPAVRDRMRELEERFAGRGIRTSFISAASREGLEPLWGKVLELLTSPGTATSSKQMDYHRVLRPQFKRERVERRSEDGVFVVFSSKAERIAAVADLSDWRVRAQFYTLLARMGVVKALEEKGIKSGDVVRIGEVEMEWQ